MDGGDHRQDGRQDSRQASTAGIAPNESGMFSTRLLRLAIGSVILAAPIALGQVAGTGPQRVVPYRLEPRSGRAVALDATYSDLQLALLEKLNRADRAHLAQLPQL